MNAVHWHLLLNHFPIIGGIIGSLILLAGLILKGDIIKKIGLCILLFSAILALPTHATGEEAEEVVEELPNISHKLVHEHEELAETFRFFTISMILLSIGALVSLQKQHSMAKIIIIITFVVSVASSFWAARVGNSGGVIMRQETLHAKE